MIIKICGITNFQDAEFAVKNGANWIGIIQYPKSARHVEILQAKAISAKVRDLGAEPVGVFVNSSAAEILTICQQANLNYIQLHGPISRQAHHLLSDAFTRIYVRSVTYEGALIEDIDGGEKYLVKERDYLLFDGMNAGSGCSFNWGNLNGKIKTLTEMRFLIAGGLNSENVANAITILQPDGVDVSSGVESSLGVKSQPLIESFIKKVNH